ncbi:hypothetical protein, partial [Desulfomicrobium escambiense]|uniref:hypothetical protein n=1 Tax=Desulfomicrobium escambiense TaxID=29503 RepID=UPI0006874E8E
TGRKVVIEAGTDLTIKAGGSFIRLDPSGVTIGGAKVRINSGGCPGSGTGARPLLPLDAQEPTVEAFSPDDCNVLQQKNSTECARQTGLPFCAACASCPEEK